MTDAALLVQYMKEFVARIPRGEEKVLSPEYIDKIKAVGDVPFLVQLFNDFADSDLISWMFILGSYWKDVPFETWKQVLREVQSDRRLLYQFVWIASQFLAIDVAAMIRADEQVSKDAGEFLAYQFPSGGPRAGTRWFAEMFEDHGLDQWAIWSRLESEGAPMNIDLTTRSES